MTADRIPDHTKEPIVGVVTEQLGGYSSPLYYSEQDLEAVLEFHGRLAGQGQLQSPFFENSETGEPLTFSEIELGGVLFRAGPVGAFSKQEMAALVQEQAWNYANQGTMGTKFPLGEIDPEQELLSVFIDGFAPSDLIIYASKRTDQGIKPVGGARIVFGSSGRSLSESVFVDNSTLPTFQAVFLDALCEDFDPQLLQLPESQVACITRYWGQRADVSQSLGVDRRRTPADVIALMGPLYSLYSFQHSNPEPRVAVFDIHRRDTFDFVRRKFGAVTVSDGDNVQPTAAILRTILRHHYGGEEYGGYRGKINIGLFQTVNLMTKSIDYWAERGVLDFGKNGSGEK